MSLFLWLSCVASCFYSKVRGDIQLENGLLSKESDAFGKRLLLLRL